MGYFVAVFDNITERKRAEGALRKSEERLVEAQRIARLGSFEWDIVGNVIHWSDELYRIFGIEPQQLRATYEGFLERVHPDDRERLSERLEATLSQGKPYIVEHRIVLPDGTVRWMLFQGEVQRDADGNPTRLSGTAQDITDRKRAEQALRESEGRYRALFEQAADSIVLVDAETGALVEFNDKAHENLGYTREEFQSLKIAEFEVFESPEEVAKHTARIIEEGTDTFETKHRTKGGEMRDILVSSRAVSVGGRDFVCSIWRDITERKRAEEELAKHRDHLEELVEQRSRELAESREKLRRSERLASIGTLAAGIAHEINNPVGGMLLAAQNALMIKRRGGDEKVVTACLQDIVGEAKRCGQIVRNVLRFARAERAQQWPADLNAIIQGALRHTREQVEQHGATVETSLTTSLPQITLNPVEMEQVFVNLIRNAVESGPDGVRVTIRTESTPAAVRAVVQDDGPGIPDRLLNRLFDPFFTTRQNHGGTGLGLSIVHGIVRDHGGTIDVKSQPGVGTTFTIDLPHAPPVPAQEKDLADSCPGR